jgi:acyl-CoA synthetase (AMP-forming)/AMP-acid ligase II
MSLSSNSIVCCPPPLFHCFGLVMGFLAAFTHGSSIVFPSESFDAGAVLDTIAAEKCTAVLGVPTMFLAELDLNHKKKVKITTVKNALAAGSPVPQAVMNRLDREMGIKDILIAYGMTETSPVTFMTSSTDSHERRLKTVGTILPHTAAKIVDKEGNVVRRSQRGEICVSGYALQKGYFENELKTKEVMQMDGNGVLWMHTGDEGLIDESGYCTITGRIKDVIIRGKKLKDPRLSQYTTDCRKGGENIFPVEIEERLLAHPSIGEASVVGHSDERYGEVVACFLRHNARAPRPTLPEVSKWVKEALGGHKAPKHVWWIGDPGIGDDFPKTGSGKHQKHILRAIGQRLIKPDPLRARL